MTSKKELREDRQYWQSKALEEEARADEHAKGRIAAEKDRDKYLRQLQNARKAFEDLKRALYPDTYPKPAVLPSLPSPFPGTLFPFNYIPGTAI